MRDYTKLEKGMISLGKDPKGYDKRVRAKLKGSGSKKRVIAQRLRRLKELTPEQLEKKGIEILSSSESFDLEILFVIQEMLKKDLPDKVKLDLLGKMIAAKTALYGTKAYVNLSSDKNSWDETMERMKKFKKENETK